MSHLSSETTEGCQMQAVDTHWTCDAKASVLHRELRRRDRCKCVSVRASETDRRYTHQTLANSVKKPPQQADSSVDGRMSSSKFHQVILESFL